MKKQFSAFLYTPYLTVCSASMVSISDIPDWCWTEAVGIPKEGNATDPRASDPSAIPVATPAALARMAEASPIRFVAEGRVKAPTLLLLGVKDKRVPKENGLEYHYALKATGVQTR